MTIREECKDRAAIILLAYESADRALGTLYHTENMFWVLNAKLNISACKTDGYIETGRAHQLDEMLETAIDDIKKGNREGASVMLKRFKDEIVTDTLKDFAECECGEAKALAEHVGHEALEKILKE